MSLPATQMRPPSGSSSLFRRRMNVDLPEPDGPTRKTNSPFWMSADASRSATTSPLYCLVTFSSLITGRETPTGRGPSQGTPAYRGARIMPGGRELGGNSGRQQAHEVVAEHEALVGRGERRDCVEE